MVASQRTRVLLSLSYLYPRIPPPVRRGAHPPDRACIGASGCSGASSAPGGALSLQHLPHSTHYSRTPCPRPCRPYCYCSRFYLEPPPSAAAPSHNCQWPQTGRCRQSTNEQLTNCHRDPGTSLPSKCSKEQAGGSREGCAGGAPAAARRLLPAPRVNREGEGRRATPSVT